jgi:hypothetical protein
MVKAMYLPQFSVYLGKITEKRQYYYCLFSVYLRNWYHIGSYYRNGF